MNLDKTFVIGEAGTCHAHDDPDQRYLLAMDYVYAAFAANADAIKFQIFDNPTKETMFCWIDGDEERSPRWHQSRLRLDQWRAIKQLCDELELVFLASVFEYETVKWLSELNVEATKVASRAAGDLNEFRYAPKPLLVSNGMYPVSSNQVSVLQCEANYPSTALWNNVGGFSDHSGSPWRAIAAIVGGCKLIEVHFYIEKEEAGPDLPASITTNELALICEARDSME